MESQSFCCLNPVDSEPYSISVAHYNLKSLETLKQKLIQFPRGTVFAYVITTNGEDAKAKEVFQQLKNYLEDHGMKLEWEGEGSQSEP